MEAPTLLQERCAQSFPRQKGEAAQTTAWLRAESLAAARTCSAAAAAAVAGMTVVAAVVVDTAVVAAAAAAAAAAAEEEERGCCCRHSVARAAWPGTFDAFAPTPGVIALMELRPKKNEST